MDFQDFTLIAVGILAFALVSARIAGWAVTMPMAFVTLGAVTDAVGLVSLEVETEGVALIGEITLAVILFGDAVRIDLGALRRELGLPVRLLSIGLPLTIVVATIAVAVLVPAISFWEAALVGAILTPTDAALGQAVVEDQSVPQRVRQGLNVESGLNDGMVVPVVALFTAFSIGESDSDLGFWVAFVGEQIGLGTVIGAAAGAGGGWLLSHAMDRGMVEGIYAQLGTLAIGFGAFAAAVAAGANGFIAAFVAGLSFGAVMGMERADHLDEYTEDTGRLLAMVAFFLFGNLFVNDAISATTVAIIICSVATLTVGRMLPVALAMIGMGQNWRTTLFVGWFGPRGLASILFGLLLLEEALPGAEELFAIIAWTVVVSVFAHGLTAARGAAAYGHWYGALSDDHRDAMPETMPVVAHRARWAADEPA
ncbi:MAG: cation:proton antiporter [Acidimicrobiia bacterium]|nr:cation:proton antiporter [Acidimicrobiia bacterium]